MSAASPRSGHGSGAGTPLVRINSTRACHCRERVRPRQRCRAEPPQTGQYGALAPADGSGSRISVDFEHQRSQPPLAARAYRVLALVPDDLGALHDVRGEVPLDVGETQGRGEKDAGIALARHRALLRR